MEEGLRKKKKNKTYWKHLNIQFSFYNFLRENIRAICVMTDVRNNSYVKNSGVGEKPWFMQR